MIGQLRRLLMSAGLVALGACKASEAPHAAPPLFERLPPSATHVTFENRLPEDSTFNIVNYLYYFNGGGVAVGDIDNDGLPDLYFTANLGPDRLYRNKGNYQFEDVTERANLAGPEGWKTGVTMADVNGDGCIDIYVSAISYLTMQGHNVLYINDGDGTFTDRTREYGLEFVGYSTQSLFFDYDGDGDLDMYLLNQSTHSEGMMGTAGRRDIRHPRAGDKLFRNDKKHFVDVSERAHIYGGVEGFGLGVVASDLNLDGCPDLYVANDFQENDFLYYNNCDGTFTESIARATGHTSRFSMGVDAADFSNDGRPDLAVMDMLPDREEVLKTSASSETYSLFQRRVEAGYHPQYSRNTLQLNRGGGRFSEIAFLAGVYATDWSWAPLFADLDNDGLKDLFVTAGIYRRPNDLDYISYVGNEAVQASLASGASGATLAVLKRMPQVPVPNAMFRNNGDLTFTNVAESWGLAEPGFSNGAVYADLNNSGALDLVVNNINAPASIYRSRARERNANHFLTITLRGAGANTAGIGAKVAVRHDGRLQMLEQMPTRGFQSSVDPRLHFGLGASAGVDSLTVVWPDRRFQTLTNVRADTILSLAQKDAAGRYEYSGALGKTPLLFADATAASHVDFAHRENSFLDFNREPLMPHVLSAEGPALATGDVNGDGLDDLYVGGAKWQPGTLYLQRAGGTFAPVAAPALLADSLDEDTDAAFFDANGDGALDLYVVSGGNEFWGDADALQDRLYLNDGAGGFRRSLEALPRLSESGSCVVPGDFDGDGDLDLFVGRRVVSKSYGLAPRSYLLENDGRGRFRDVTLEKAPTLADVGMVSSAAWVRRADPKQLDLVVAGEWMPIRVFRFGSSHFTDVTREVGFAGTSGWWNDIAVADLNADGRDDLVLGNLGLNAYLKASAKEPARLYVHDFFQTGSLKQILTTYKHGVSYPLASRDELVNLMPALRNKYPSYAAFGASRVEDIFPAADLKAAKMLEASEFSSSVALSNADGTFTLQALPMEAQFAPIYASLAGDFDGDGPIDLLLGGNFFGVPPMLGRYDASYGLLLRGTGNGHFVAVDLETSGLAMTGQVRAIRIVRQAGGKRLIAVARNNDTLQMLRPLH